MKPEISFLIILMVMGLFFTFLWLLNRWLGDKPFVPLSGTLVAFLVDPNPKMTDVYTTVDVIQLGRKIYNKDVIFGDFPYKTVKDDMCPVRLQRSGTGFRVWNCPGVEDGTWLPCRT